MGFYNHFHEFYRNISNRKKSIFLHGIRTFAENKKCNLKNMDEQRRWEYFLIALVGYVLYLALAVPSINQL
jgi:hypothetical protein